MALIVPTSRPVRWGHRCFLRNSHSGTLNKSMGFREAERLASALAAFDVHDAEANRSQLLGVLA